jgi:signal transduction histidine kinase
VLGQLAGGVSHELRNPLSAIKNATYFLNMTMEEPDPEVKETLEILEKEVSTSERIVGDQLDYARSKPPVRRRVDLNDIVRETLSSAAIPDAPQIELMCQFDKELPNISADPDQLKQIFDNLIRNDAQAMPEGGQLVVKTEMDSLEWVAVSIIDEGVGIPEKGKGRPFEPLLTTKSKGIGLGPAIVKMLLEGNGGVIEAESEVGKDSAFRVRLPLISSEGEQHGKEEL